MNIKVEFNNLNAIESAEEAVSTICKPLFEAYHLNYFCYTRIFPDKSHSVLTTDFRWKKYFYTQASDDSTWLIDVSALKSKDYYFIWDDKVSRRNNPFACEKIAKAANEIFGLHHGLSIYIKQPTYYEQFTMATDIGNFNANTTYDLQEENIRKFLFYFKDKAASLIKKIDNKKIITTKDKSSFSLKKNPLEITEEFNTFTINKFHFSGLNGDCYLTRRELECVVWGLQGKTREEVSLILEVSKETIKQHYKNIMKKFGVEKLIDVIRLIDRQIDLQSLLIK